MKRINYWLLKSEPHVFSIEDLIQRPQQRECWDGVRNHQAKRFLQQMAVDDLAFFYHSNAKPSGIVGVVRISRSVFPDPSQFDAQSAYFDAKANLDHPIWWQVEVEFKEKFSEVIPLSFLKAQSALQDMILIKQSRLSVSPVTEQEWQWIMSWNKKK